MGSAAPDTTLYLKYDDHNLEVGKYKPHNYNPKFRLFKLNDLFSNNADIELSKISVMHLENCEISNIPRSFQHLNLKQLILCRNKLSEVPSCLYLGLRLLEVLDLSHNLLKTFDIEPGCSQSLATLKLGNNQLYNFPCWVLTLPCPKLVEVDYMHNQIVQVKSSRRIGIKKLVMSNTLLMDCDFVFLKRLESLEYLDISNDNSSRNMNRFTDIDNLFVKTNWKYLKILILNNLSISILSEDIFKITSLVELHLVNCDISWIPAHIQWLQNLELIDISKNSIGSIPEQLSKLAKLRILKASYNCISFISEFVNNLEVLDLYDNDLEKIPSFVDKMSLIDLENNFIDTCLYENYANYQIKKEKLRQMFGNERSDGLKEQLPESFSDKNSITSEESDNNNYKSETYVTNYESECWDDEEPIHLLHYRKNPDVTTSDDEWNGNEEHTSAQSTAFKKMLFFWDPHEDWVFGDAE